MASVTEFNRNNILKPLKPPSSGSPLSPLPVSSRPTLRRRHRRPQPLLHSPARSPRSPRHPCLSRLAIYRMSPRPRSDRKSSKHQTRNRSTRKTTGITSKIRSNRSSDHVRPNSLLSRRLTLVVTQDALHLDSPLTDPDIESLRQPPSLNYSAIAATDSLGGVHSNLAWFKPFNKPAPPPSAPRDDLTTDPPEVCDAAVDAAAIVTTEPIRATRLGRGRARKGDRQGDLVWPEHIEAALIEGRSGHHTDHTAIAHFACALGLRLYHCTSSEDLHPSHTRNFGRNVKVSRFITQKTGVYRSTRQISSRIQVLRSLWRDTEGTRAIPAHIIVILFSVLGHESNLIGGPFSRLCSRRPATRTTADGIQNRSTATDPPCGSTARSNDGDSQADSSSVWGGRQPGTALLSSLSISLTGTCAE